MTDISADTELTVKEGVTRGGPFLDTNYTGWKERVDLGTMYMGDPRSCMLAQASGKTWDEAQREHGLTVIECINLGFAVSHTHGEDLQVIYGLQLAEWRRQYFD